MYFVGKVLFFAFAASIVSNIYGGSISRFHNFVQVADGGEFRSSFLIYNPDTEPCEITLTFRLDNGELWEISIGGETSSIFTRYIPSRGTLTLSTDRSTSDIVTGWAKLSATTEVGAQSFFEMLAGDRLLSQAAVESTGPVRNITIFVDENTHTHTGVSVVNLSETGRTRLSLTLTNEFGGVSFSKTLSFGANEHLARFVSELFPGIAPFRGTLNISSSGPFEALNLQLSGTALSTLPILLTVR